MPDITKRKMSKSELTLWCKKDRTALNVTAAEEADDDEPKPVRKPAKRGRTTDKYDKRRGSKIGATERGYVKQKVKNRNEK